jgi:hypothetical protein
MTNAMDTFLDEGFRRFAEANDAITLFTNTVQRRLGDMLEQRTWSGFSPVLNKLRTEWKNSPNLGLYICATVPGELDGKSLTLDCGYWWNPSKFSARLVAYASFYENPAVPEQLDYTPRDPRIQTRRVERMVRLYIADPNRDPTTDVSTLITELMDVPWRPVLTDGTP